MQEDPPKNNGLENAERSARYGLKLSQLTEEVLKDILIIYDQVVGGAVWDRVFSKSSPSIGDRLNKIQEGLRHSNVVDWRFGSRLKGDERLNAKFCLWREEGISDGDMIIRFSFDPNLVHGEEAESLQNEFEKAINNYLTQKGLAIELRQ